MRVSLIVLGVLSAVGCESQQSKQCTRLVQGMEQELNALDPTDEASVEAVLVGLGRAERACRSAGRDPEVKDIESAEKSYDQHLANLRKQAQNPFGNGEEVSLEVLEQSGDPNCPAGQGYEHPVLGKLVKCSGTALIDMTLDEAQEHFQGLGYSTQTKESSHLFHKDSSAYLYTFIDAETPQKPQCLQLLVPEGQSFQHATSFATNVPVENIAYGQELEIKRGKFKLEVNEADDGTVVQIGECQDAPELTGKAAHDVSVQANTPQPEQQTGEQQTGEQQTGATRDEQTGSGK